jgi:transcriptional regulator with XRE-family HTH domain
MGKTSKLYDQIAEKIKSLREEYDGGKGISQESLADAISTKPNTISRWEKTVYKPKAEDLEKLAKFFGVPISVFFPDIPNEKPEIKALMSATADLHANDIKELTDFALFRKARSKLREAKK